MNFSPYPWHYTLRWLYYFFFPSSKKHSNIARSPVSKKLLIDQDVVRLLFCGDIMVMHGDRVPEFSKELVDLMRSADKIIANCEAPVGMHDPDPNQYYHFSYHMPWQFLQGILSQVNIANDRWVLNVANNHSGDAGLQAYDDSVGILNSIGITTIGNYSDDLQPIQCVTIKNRKIGLFGWTQWMNKEVFSKEAPGVFRSEHVNKYIGHQLKQNLQLDYLIGYPHWEYEFQHFPHKSTQLLAGNLINHHGVDAIIGTHPHTLQPLEWFDNGFCCYSLGNFCGLGVAWSVKLISLLELNLTNKADEACQIQSYRLHFFAQIHEDDTVKIVPLAELDHAAQQKMLRLIDKLYINGT